METPRLTQATFAASGGVLPDDTTPDSFSFADQTDVAISTLTMSNIIPITGIAARQLRLGRPGTK
jgi:Ca2+/Na+ antiporter